ncbi:MAG: hypothetical protein AAFY28_05015 [Actinomycetota bacterium]
MLAHTRSLWELQTRHGDDRVRLFAAVADALDSVDAVLYPGSFVDITASMVWHDVTYVDVDARAPRFFADTEGITEILNESGNGADGHRVTFFGQDYTDDLPVEHDHFDLLISLYAGFITEHCTQHLRVGGHALVNSSHGDAAMASIDPRYELAAVITSRNGRYAVRRDGLDHYLVPKRPTEVTVESLHESGRGIAYTRSPFAYLFTRVS